jgi:hypothetical protein
MSLYAIKDKDGELRDVNGRTAKSEFGFGAFVHYGLAKNHQQSTYPGSRVVELVEKAEPVEVSEEAGKTLADLYQEICYGETDQYAADYVRELHTAGMSIGDIFRALDVGWTVKQPQRWYVKAPKEWALLGGDMWFYKSDGNISYAYHFVGGHTTNEQFTADEIDKYHLGGFETVEVEG